MELFGIIVNDWKLLTIIGKSPILCCSSPRSASENSYLKCDIPFQLINNCNDLLYFILLIWLFLNLGPTITWNWKLKQWNTRRLLIILTVKPVAYNLRNFLRFIFIFSILSLLTCLFLRYDFVKTWHSLIFNVTSLPQPRRV